jgi:inorganic pyrophosphatase
VDLQTTIGVLLLADAVVAKTKLHGLPIHIEHKRGSIRELKDSKGNVVYKKLMKHDYGFINNTKGRDGDEVDCFVGPLKNSDFVYIVHMKDMGPVKSEREDEDKLFCGFPSAEAAKHAFLQHYPPNFFQSMTVMPVDEFKRRLKQTQKPYRHKMLHASFDEWSKAVKSAKCPKCGSKKFDLMPSDFETAECNDCGKQYNINVKGKPK